MNHSPHFDLDRSWLHPMQNPLALGANVVVHSVTKYLGGHGDLTPDAAAVKDAELALHVCLYRLKGMTGAVMSAMVWCACRPAWKTSTTWSPTLLGAGSCSRGRTIAEARRLNPRSARQLHPLHCGRHAQSAIMADRVAFAGSCSHQGRRCHVFRFW